MRTLAIINQKGGCGKTTTAINLAAVLARRGLRTLLIDMDPQSHCAMGLGVPEGRIDASVGDALLKIHDEKFDPTSVVWEVGGNLALMPSTVRLAGLEAPGGGLHEMPDRDRRLAMLVNRVADRYDRCLIDCPPTIGLLTFNALRAAREALIPVETGFFALRGADKQWKTIRQLIERIGRPIACHIVPTLFRPDSALATDILAAMRRQFAGQVVPVVVREDEIVREAASFGQPVIEYSPRSEACGDFEKLAEWLEEHPPNPGVQIEVLTGAAGAGVHVTTAPGPPPQLPPLHGRAAELAERVRGRAAIDDGSDAGDNPPPSGPVVPEPADAIPAPAPQARLTPPAPVGTEFIGPLPLEQVVHNANGPEGRDFGVVATDGGVRFRQPAGGSHKVYLAGDFNHWSSTSTPLPLDEGASVHEAMLALPPGRYRYRLIVDGRWEADQYNHHKEVNDYGEFNSVVVVPDVSSTAGPA